MNKVATLSTGIYPMGWDDSSTTGATAHWNYPYYTWDPSQRVIELEARIEALEEMLEMLEEKTGYEVVEEPRFKVRKKRK